MKIVNASGRTLKVGATTASSTIDGIFDVSTPVPYKYLKSELAGDFLVLENIGFGNSFAQWKIIQQYGQWNNTDLKLEARTLIGKEVYGSNSTGSADISAIELDGLNRSCFFRAAGVNALGLNVQHTVNNGYAFQIRQKDYTSSNIMVRVKNNNIWTDWVEYLPMKQALSSLNSAASPSAIYQQSEAQSVLEELRDLKAKLRAAGIMAN